MDDIAYRAVDMPRVMITYDTGKFKFNYRVVGIALSRGRVLLHRAETEDFWTLPGGRGEMGEAAEETLKREMREELRTEVQVERLVWFVENFFDYDGKSYHELALYFLMSFPDDAALYREVEPFIGYEEAIELIFQWHSLHELEQLRLYPSFLMQGLRALPDHTQHVVHIDEAV